MNMKYGKPARAAICAALALAAATAAAHHSAALFYDLKGHSEVTGTVTEFRFANPHAVLKLDVVAEDGEIQHWTAETTSPSILRRRGWSQQSFTPGEKVRIEGLPSVDGSYLIRIQRAFREDGTEIGIPRGTDN
jgi:DNA/RNA endonuclease YhcR with UshA esterase domain